MQAARNILYFCIFFASLIYVDAAPRLQANAEHLARFLRSGHCVSCTLSGADLRNCKDRKDCRADYRGARLRKSRLEGVVLSRARLQRADLRATVLDGAQLDRTDLRLADLRGASLRGANLTKAMLQGADLSRADLRNADLREADLAYVTLDDTKLSGAHFERTILPNGKRCSGACLKEVAPGAAGH